MLQVPPLPPENVDAMDNALSFITASATAKALSVVGDQWSYLILRDMFLGRHRFEELLKSTGASRGTLTKRLTALVDNGVLYRNPITGSRRFEYRLTDKGLDLYPLAIAAWLWEVKWAEDDAVALPKSLIHKDCGHVTYPLFTCRCCHEELQAHDVQYSIAADRPPEESPFLTRQKRARKPTVSREGADRSLFHVIDGVSDRWTSLILAGAFMGADRFDTFHKDLGIATNILADRLKKLTKNQILERVDYQENPPRSSYKLTPKAYDLYPMIISLHQWGSRWLESERNGGVIQLKHKCSDQTLEVSLVCNNCQQRVRSSDISFQ